jgi:hypothetical protein
MAESHGWCSLRLRFEERELELLRGAEAVRGAAIAQASRPADLRSALSLVKVGQKVRRGVPGGSLTFEESELQLLLEAVRFAVAEVQTAARPDGNTAVIDAFPELEQKGTWRAFGLARELEALAERLTAAQNG